MFLEIFGAVFEGFYRLTGSYGISLILLSFSVSVLIFPFQKIADYFKKKDRLEKSKFEAVARDYKQTYEGTERYFYLKYLHKIHGYHPVKSLSGLAGLAIQIPFFILAYRFLSEFEGYRNVGFLFIPDLAEPDGLIGGVNLLPLLMTLINMAAVLLFTANRERSERLQLYGLSAVFLILLYSSPAGLVFYWLMNNLFSFLKELTVSRKTVRPFSFNASAIKNAFLNFIKNAATAVAVFIFFIEAAYLVFFIRTQADMENIETDFALNLSFAMGLAVLLYFIVLSFVYLKIIFRTLYLLGLSAVFCFILFYDYLDVHYIFIKKLPEIGLSPEFLQDFPVRLLIFIFCLISAAVMGKPFFSKISGFIFKPAKNPKELNKALLVLGFSLLLLFFLFPGLHIIGSSPGEFPERHLLAAFSLIGFAGTYTFLILPLLILPLSLKKWAAGGLIFFNVYLLLNYFVFDENYGGMDFFIFNRPDLISPTIDGLFRDLMVLAFVTASVFAVTRILLPHKLTGAFGILSAVLLVLLIIPVSGILKNARSDQSLPASNASVPLSKLDNLPSKYIFSETGKNVLIIFFDRFQAHFFKDILEDLPEMKRSLRGFVWYPNTLSFSGNTSLGLPPIHAGYEFTNVQRIRDIGTDWFRLGNPELNKYFLESTPFTIKKFLSANYRTFINDPTYLGEKWFGNPEIVKAWGKNSDSDNLIGKYSSEFLHNQKVLYKNYSPVLSAKRMFWEYLLPFSFFKCLPPSLRERFYGNGSWWSETISNHWIKAYVDNLSLAFVWPFLSKVEPALPGTFNFATNNMTHAPYAARDNSEFTLGHATTNTVFNVFDFIKSIPSKFKPDTVFDNIISSGIDDNTLTRFGSARTAVHYFAAKEAIVRVNAWLDWLKINGVYNNTKIVIVSDHGAVGILDSMLTGPADRHNFADGKYHPIFLVKEFDAGGDLTVNDDLMTNADVPSIALSAIDPDAAKKYGYDKSKGFRLFTESGNLTVYDNLFDPKNWVYLNE